MTRALTTAALLFSILSSSAAAQINVPPTTPAHEPIVAALELPDVPDGADVQVSWRCSPGVRYIFVGRSLHIWAAPNLPGEQYQLSATAVWIVTRAVTIDGQEVRVLENWGLRDYTAEFAVVGEVPPPNPPQPDPPVPTPGKKFIVVVQESSQQTPELANLWLALRANERIKAHNLLVIDKDVQTPSLRAYADRATSVPWVCFVDAGSGKVLLEGACPTSVAGVLEMLAKVSQ